MVSGEQEIELKELSEGFYSRAEVDGSSDIVLGKSLSLCSVRRWNVSC